MRVVGASENGIPPDQTLRVRQLSRSAATHFDKAVPFCDQRRHVIASAMTYLELHEPRLAVCELSWGACALLSRYANNAAAHHAKKLARPVAAGQSPAVAPPLPPPRHCRRSRSNWAEIDRPMPLAVRPDLQPRRHRQSHTRRPRARKPPFLPRRSSID
eukprot:TRINITY_DN817_c0_g1_i17.p2 TRINITY_DN817_c0_g1~~TRINITY_DN817_c0_g1_i17.p2  ORF type:complete len:159 (+),score=23.80 TRINITY_DN817_c0_g1_i17:405-881(+)